MITPSIEDMQNEILALGWVFQEQTFPNGDVVLKFKQTEEFNPYANGPTLMSSDGWNLGWGRFQRRHAWLQAYDWIVNGNKGDR